MPWNFAVQLSATVDDSRSTVTLRWPAPALPPGNVKPPVETVYRKAVSDLGNPGWGPGTVLPIGQYQYVDSIRPGVAYEYGIWRHYDGADPQFDGFGYIRTGIRVPFAEDRGTVLLVVDGNVAPGLGDAVSRLVNDLAGDGWNVVETTNFTSASSPADLRSWIQRQAQERGLNVQAVFLLGHLPVALSGTATNPDGHYIRPMPADGFYGDVGGDWGSPTFDGAHWVYPDNVFPGTIAIEVGRVDFADMPAVYAVSPFSSEIALLRNYLAKDHAYRTAVRVPARRAIIGDAFGEYYWEGSDEPFSADGYRNFAPLFGSQVKVDDDFHGDASGASAWLGDLSAGSYLWAYGCAAGGDTGDAVSALDTDNELASADFVTRDAQADFYMLFGSFVVNWSLPNSLMRAALAPAEYGLACSWAGRPFLYYHAMGLGATIGYGIRISENQTGALYETPVTVRADGNHYAQGVYMGLLGDPTLRLDPVPPVENLSSDPATGAVTWSAPAGAVVQEYRAYRLNSGSGRYELEATLPASAASYSPTHSGEYMIRLVTLQTGSGTYFDGSEGAFWSVPPGAPGRGAAGGPGTSGTSTGSAAGTVGPPAPSDPALPQVQFGIPLMISQAPR